MQGDQLGVEFGISAHVGLLVEEGALLEEHMLRTDRLPRPNGLFQGLVVDDFFNIAQVPAKSLRQPPAAVSNPGHEAFLKAKLVYSQEGLQGSDVKDVIDHSCQFQPSHCWSRAGHCSGTT